MSSSSWQEGTVLSCSQESRGCEQHRGDSSGEVAGTPCEGRWRPGWYQKENPMTTNYSTHAQLHSNMQLEPHSNVLVPPSREARPGQRQPRTGWSSRQL